MGPTPCIRDILILLVSTPFSTTLRAAKDSTPTFKTDLVDQAFSVSLMPAVRICQAIPTLLVLYGPGLLRQEAVMGRSNIQPVYSLHNSPLGPMYVRCSGVISCTVRHL